MNDGQEWQGDKLGETQSNERVEETMYKRKDELKASLKELISALIDGGIRYMWVSVWVR